MSEKRLEKVLAALTGRERALLYLREYKAGTGEPVGVGVGLLSLPEQRVFNRLMSLIQFCSNELADIVLVVREQVAQEELRFLALEQMRVHADDLWLIRRYLKECVPEPVTADEKESRALVRKFVAKERRYRLPFDVSAPLAENPRAGEETARTITVVIRDRLTSCWVQLKSVDKVVGEYAEEFGGEDPLQPQIRRFLDDALARCDALNDELQPYTGKWDLPDDLGEALVLMRKLAERAVR